MSDQGGDTRIELMFRLEAALKRIEQLEAALRDLGDQTAWVIENEDPPVYAVLTDDFDEHFSPDINKALRFSRREDAQAFIDYVGWTSPKPVEHMWVAPRAALGQKADDCKTVCMRTGLAIHDWSDPRVGARGYCGDCPRTGAKEMNLVERLRSISLHDDVCTAMDEAADRIEQLEAALRSLYEWYDRDGSVGGASDVFEDNRAALDQSSPPSAKP